VKPEDGEGAGRGVQALVFARYGALHRRVKEDEEELLCGGIPIGEAGLGQVLVGLPR
jgi:hypothetical protein